jgi:hypothetical protein
VRAEIVELTNIPYVKVINCFYFFLARLLTHSCNSYLSSC